MPYSYHIDLVALDVLCHGNEVRTSRIDRTLQVREEVRTTDCVTMPSF